MVFPTLNVYQNHLGCLLKIWFLDSPPEILQSKCRVVAISEFLTCIQDVSNIGVSWETPIYLEKHFSRKWLNKQGFGIRLMLGSWLLPLTGCVAMSKWVIFRFVFHRCWGCNKYLLSLKLLQGIYELCYIKFLTYRRSSVNVSCLFDT